MKVENYSLSLGKKELLSNVNVEFAGNQINHILGSNGVGKSCFAKSLVGIYHYGGTVSMQYSPVIIGSYSNIPSDLTVKDLFKIIADKYDKKELESLKELLNLNIVKENLILKKLSDGQKQKIKILAFFVTNPHLIILDEFSSAIDKKSLLDIYSFLNDYVRKNDVIILNITHNLSDIEYMEGKYYLFSDKNIMEIKDKQMIIDLYVKGC